MDVLPLPKKIYDQCKAAGITNIGLHWSGGGGDACLYASLSDCVGDTYHQPRGIAAWDTLREEIENWAYNESDYCGAGDGTEYGDDVVYDLVNHKVTTRSWFHKPHYDPAITNVMEIQDG